MSQSEIHHARYGKLAVPTGNEKYRLLIGWLSGADSNGGEDTGIENQNDLRNADNENVNVFEFELPPGLGNIAWEVGASHAFRANFTAADTLSIVQKQRSDGEWVDV